MAFSLGRLIEELSAGMTLMPADTFLAGTPEGVGTHRVPPEYLHPGDEIVIESPQLGTLRNVVAADAGAARPAGPM